MTVRAAVVGLGMGRNHARAYHTSPRADLVAICDLNPALLAEYQAQYPQAKAYTDYQEMFAKARLDAISIALPNFLHAPVAKAALEAGINVLCEKPMALNATDAQSMLATARASGKKLMIHFNYRYSAQSQFLKRYVDEGHLGQVYYARTRWLRSRGIPKLGGWFGIKRLSGGGPLIDLGVHRLDLAMWLMGYPKAVSVSASSSNLLGARIAREQGVEFDCEDLVTALVRLDNGASLNLEVSWAGGTDRREDMMTGIYGTGGAVIQRNVGHGYDFECLALDDAAGQLVRVEPQILPAQVPSAVDDFVDCVADDREPTASAEHGLEMMRIIDAIYRSAQEQREVRLDV
ncbi:MAG: Gfo/Idh/MocA family oxidoreductase [Chloroflexi bacterium]|nr:Gfo/Idh/MocA family oxidoreductase [Chloroflexota bacterium]